MKKSPNALTELDHLMVAVFDHGKAMRAFSELGFTIRPVRQLAPMGGAEAGGNGGSAAILLNSVTPGCANYIELAMADPVTAQSFMKTLLRQKEGPAMLVHATQDPQLLAQQWSSLGFELKKFGFSVQPFGAGDRVDIDIVLPLPGQAPFAFNACRYSDVSDFERDEYRNHANGAQRWAGLTIAFEQDVLANAIKQFADIYGVEPTPSPSGGVYFQPAAGRFEIVSAQQYQAIYGEWGLAPIIHIVVENLATTRNFFIAKELQFQATGAAIMIDPVLGRGAVLLFKEA